MQRNVRFLIRLVSVLALVTFLAVGWQEALLAQAAYTVNDLGANTYPTGINNAGQVVGIYSGSKGFLWDRIHGLRDLAIPLPQGYSGVLSLAINDAGDIAGVALRNDSTTHAFLYRNGAVGMIGASEQFAGSIIDLDSDGTVTGTLVTAGGSELSAFVYNSATGLRTIPPPAPRGISSGFAIRGGRVVGGASADANHPMFAFLYDGVIHDLGTLGGPTSRAEGLNASGQAVGWSETGLTNSNGYSNERAFLYSGGQMRSLGAPEGYANSYASKINSYGQVIGYAVNPPGTPASFLWTPNVPNGTSGTMQNLGDLIPSDSGWGLEAVSGINDARQIAGWGQHNGTQHAFLMTLVDSDGDGIPDMWERDGRFWYDGKWVSLLDADTGRAPDSQHKDVYVWVDYMELKEGKPSDHSERPSDTAIAMIKQAFATAPVSNPDGMNGINLHVIVAPQPVRFPDTNGNLVSHVDLLGTPNVDDDHYDWSMFNLVKRNSKFQQGSSLFCHYCLFAHDHNSKLQNSGLAHITDAKGTYISGSDFIVSLGSYPSGFSSGKPVGYGGSVSQQAGTFMHELGHTLGLAHGGPIVENGVPQIIFQVNENFKPNYLSVMNYSFQFYGLIYKGRNQLFDYSRFNLPELDETRLNEYVGLNGGPEVSGYGTTWFYGDYSGKQAFTRFANLPINWNQNFNRSGQDILETGVQVDVNKYGPPHIFNITYMLNDGVRITEPLRSYKDWDNLYFRGGSIGAGAPIPQPTMSLDGEMDMQTAMTIRPFPPAGLATRAAPGAIRLGWTPVGPRDEWLYSVYRSGDGKAFALIGQTAAAAFTDSIVTKGKTYYYSISDVNTLGVEGLSSEAVSATAR